MATYRELLARVKDEIDEVTATDVLARLDDPDRPLLVDVREQDEWQEGHLPGAIHVPRGNLESRIEALVPDKSREIVAYCAVGARSAFAAKALGELGYDNASSLTGGFVEWKRNGNAFVTPKTLTRRAARPLLAPPPHPRGRRRGAAEAPERARAPDRRGRARLARRRSTSPRPESARSASSTPTSSTTPTCSARSSTRPTRSARPRCSPRSGRSRRSTPT